MGKRKKWSYDDIKNTIEENKGYKLISSLEDIDDNYKYYVKDKLYIKKKVIIKIQCGICKEIYEVTFDAFYNGARHYNCAREKASLNRRYNIDEIEKQLSYEGYRFANPNQYETKDSMCEIICSRGHHWNTTIHNFDHYKCPYCNEEDRLVDNYIKLINYLHSIDYIFISYKNNENNNHFTCGYVTYYCNNGHINTQQVQSLYAGKRCIKCSTTKGELKIALYLQSKNIDYIQNKRYFNNLIGIGNERLKPDFIIEDKKIWIEYDGIGHFEPTDFAGKGKEWAEENFKTLKYHDKLKDEYANEHNWKLIRIPYWEYNNIEIILNEELN